LKQAISLDPHDLRAYEDFRSCPSCSTPSLARRRKTFQASVDLKTRRPASLHQTLPAFTRARNAAQRAELVFAARNGASSETQLSYLLPSPALYIERKPAPQKRKHLLDQVEADKNQYPGRPPRCRYFLFRQWRSRLCPRSLSSPSQPEMKAIRTRPKKVAECYLQLSRWHDADLWLEQRE